MTISTADTTEMSSLDAHGKEREQQAVAKEKLSLAEVWRLK